jgi:hypothetical protein
MLGVAGYVMTLPFIIALAVVGAAGALRLALRR